MRLIAIVFMGIMVTTSVFAVTKTELTASFFESYEAAISIPDLDLRAEQELVRIRGEVNALELVDSEGRVIEADIFELEDLKFDLKLISGFYAHREAARKRVKDFEETLQEANYQKPGLTPAQEGNLAEMEVKTWMGFYAGMMIMTFDLIAGPSSGPESFTLTHIRKILKLSQWVRQGQEEGGWDPLGSFTFWC